MASVWTDPELAALHSNWQRRGELVLTVGGTGFFTYAASSLPTRSITQIGVWLPLLIGLIVVGAGIYVMWACDTKRGWLPGRSELNGTSEQRFIRDTTVETINQTMGIEGANERQMLMATQSLATAVENMTAAVAVMAEALTKRSNQ